MPVTDCNNLYCMHYVMHYIDMKQIRNMTLIVKRFLVRLLQQSLNEVKYVRQKCKR